MPKGQSVIQVYFSPDYILLLNSENRERLKNFRNVDCVVTNHNEVQDVSKSQNHKLTTAAVCGLGFSRLIGFLFATQ